MTNKIPDPVDLENGEANEVEKALDELKQAISESLGKITCVNDVNKITSKLMDVRKAAQKLVNALEVEKNMSNPKPKIDIKEERYESHSFSSQKVVVSIDSTAINPLDIVKKYMLDEIKAIRETRHMLKNQYPELFSSYAC